MTILEASLRKLVKEEAVSAAVETLDATIKAVPDILRPDELRRELIEIVGQISREQLSRLQTASLTLSRKLEIQRKASPVDTPAGDVEYVKLADMRESAIRLAAQLEADPDNLFPLAEKIARFILNGEMDGKAREEDAA